MAKKKPDQATPEQVGPSGAEAAGTSEWRRPAAI
jgi:hypothetical protein